MTFKLFDRWTLRRRPPRSTTLLRSAKKRRNLVRARGRPGSDGSVPPRCGSAGHRDARVPAKAGGPAVQPVQREPMRCARLEPDPARMSRRQGGRPTTKARNETPSPYPREFPHQRMAMHFGLEARGQSQVSAGGGHDQGAIHGLAREPSSSARRPFDHLTRKTGARGAQVKRRKRDTRNMRRPPSFPNVEHSKR
jgi:hypothetical protein